MQKKLGAAVLGLLLVAVFFIVASQKESPPPAGNQRVQHSPTVASATPSSSTEPQGPSTAATALEVPWGIVELAGGDFLVTERPGRIKHVASDTGESRTVATLPRVRPIGEGGLLGIALDPEFATNRFAYLYYTYAGSGNSNTLNRLSRFTVQPDFSFTDELTLLDAIPGASNHNGGGVAFGPDGYLYVATGDASVPSLAQNTSSLAGKILRITKTGQLVADNSFNNPVYSYGHRNPQGLAWDSQGRLWATEQGSSAHDELNRIEKGKNYGWPEIEGDEQRSGMEQPIVHSQDDTWAPSGLAFLDGVLYFGGLRGQALYTYQIDSGEVTAHYANQYGRIRSVFIDRDSQLYFGTSNRDGRGAVRDGDDKIIQIDPHTL